MKWRLPLLLLSISVANAADPVRYSVRFPAPQSHYAEVEANFPASSAHSALEVFLPVWTPGSYLVREYSRNLENVSASSAQGASLPVTKTRKNRWRVEGVSGSPVTFRYRVYCREMSVRTNWVDSSFALLNGAATFLTEVGQLDREHRVTLQLPPAWKTSISGMDELAPNTFTAPDYDTLVDSPILAGNPVVHQFQVSGVPHFLVNQGETPLWDAARSVRDTQRIVEQNVKMWGSLPYSKYVFLNLIVEGGGGIEHKSSTTLMTGRYATRTRKAYLNWLGLVSHEYFHAWNVKRLRPVELGPFDYENEVYTHNLWMAEGFTEYYSGLNVRRAGLASNAEYLGGPNPTDLWGASLASQIYAVQTTPGRLTQPVEMASFDAWIKAYRPDENSANTSISYYSKGAFAAWLLDSHIRHSTNGAHTLDDLMRLLYTRFSEKNGYTTADFLNAASEITGSDINEWFRNILSNTSELNTSESLEWFGLAFKPGTAPKSDNRPRAWSGLQTRIVAGRLVVAQIPRDTPAAQFNLNVEDEILAVDGWRVLPEGWNQRLEQYSPGDTVQLLVSRRDRILTLPFTFGEEPANKWELTVRPDATVAQKEHLARWLDNPGN